MKFRGLAGGDRNSRWWLLIALHYHRFVYVSHNQQHCSYPSEVMSLSLPFASPLSLPTYLFLAPLSLYLSISLSLHPLPSSSFDHSLPPSLSPLHSFLSSPPLSSHLTLSFSSTWVVMTLLSSRTPWNALPKCWNIRNFSEGGSPDPPLVGQDATTGPHQPFLYHSMHLLCTQMLCCTLLGLGTNTLGFFWVDRLRPLVKTT